MYKKHIFNIFSERDTEVVELNKETICLFKMMLIKNIKSTHTKITLLFTTIFYN